MKRFTLGIGLGLLIGFLLVASGGHAAINRTVQDALNFVIDETYKGNRSAPAIATSSVLHNAATVTGASSAVNVAGFSRKTVQLGLLTGTATVDVEARLQNGTYKALSGCSLTVTGSTCSIVGIPFYELRTNITACNSCNVTTRLQLEP